MDDRPTVAGQETIPVTLRQMITYSGRRVDPTAPSVFDIHIEDIAHTLANRCRFEGNCRKFFSVAEHAVLVSRLCPQGTQLQGLLLDAHQVYIGSVDPEVKKLPGMARLLELEEEVWSVVAQRFSLPEFCYPAALEAAALADVLERLELMILPGDYWLPDPYTHTLMVSDFEGLACWSPDEAAEQFLARFQEIQQTV